MKTFKIHSILKTFFYLQMSALLLTTAVAGPASAGVEVPFNGTIEGTEDFKFQEGDPSGIDLIIHGSGGGNATGLGKFTGSWHGDISFANTANPLKRTFVAANGDELYSEGPGAGTPPPDQFVVEEHVITGGTGRFLGASGTFTVERWVFNVAPPFTALETSGSFHGTIILKTVPFGGVIEGTEDFNFQEGDPSGIDLIIHGSGGGSATLLGKFTATWDGDIVFANPANPIKRTFIMAGGDELYSEGPGAGTPPPDQFVTEEHVITGGTGRFLNASGTFTVERWVFNVAPPFTDLESSGSFYGNLILHP